jgi:hypothetical protein
MLLVGDFFQIAPVNGKPLCETMLGIYVRGKAVEHFTPAQRGADFFKTFRLCLLDTQHRSVDARHSSNLAALRCTDPSCFPLTRQLLSDYKILSRHDITADLSWIFAQLVVQLNKVLHAINRQHPFLFSKMTCS